VADRPPWLAGRTTGDLLILIISITIAGAVLLGEVGVVIITLIRPGTDTTTAGAAIASVINVLIGLLAGFLAGKTDTHLTITKGQRRLELDRREVGDDEPDHE
jgi:hypothetical protein